MNWITKIKTFGEKIRRNLQKKFPTKEEIVKGRKKDNEFNKPIFIPTTLNNSCLIYDSSENFFHGFKRMKPEGYRKAITFAFMSDK